MPKERSSIVRTLSFKVVSRRFPAPLFHGIVLGSCCAGLRLCCCEALSFSWLFEAYSGAARVMYYEMRSIRLEVYDLSLASIGGPSGRTTIPYSPSGSHLPGHSPSWHPWNDGLWAIVPLLTQRPTDWTVGNTDYIRCKLEQLGNIREARRLLQNKTFVTLGIWCFSCVA